MISQHSVRVDLTATGNTQAVSRVVEVPPWARTARVHAVASGWGTGTAAVVEIKHGPARAAVFSSFSPRVLFSANGASDALPVHDKPSVRAELSSAGSGGSFLDADAEFIFVFSDS